MAYTLNNLTEIANDYTDENFAASVTVNFYNEAISQINAFLGVSLPFIRKEVSVNYASTPITVLPDTWLLSVVVPYICYSIKTNDGSMNEANFAFMQRFKEGLKQLRRFKNQDIAIVYRASWVECSEAEYNNAVIKETVYCGANLPDTAFLSSVDKHLDKVVMVSNGSEEVPEDYPMKKYFRLKENKNGARIEPFNYNVRWWR